MASPAGHRVNALVLIFTLISGLTVFCRLFTRIVVIRNVGTEDAFIALAMAFSIGLAATIGIQVANGMGRHLNELTPIEIIDSQKAFWASIWIYYMSLTFTKISILVQYLRIFPTRRFRIICFSVLGVVSLYGVWALFSSIFLCYPIRFFWDKSIQDGKCIDQFAVWFSNASINILQDFVILLLPMPMLRNLEIPRRQKRALMMVFALGGVVCIISVVRLQSLLAISNSTDPTADNPPAATLSAIETNVGIITACLPALRPVLSAVLPKYFPPTTRSRYTRTIDEEQPKHLRILSATSRPPTASTYKNGHSRSTSDTTDSTKVGSELGETPKYQAALAGTATRINGPARKVHIRAASSLGGSLGGTPTLPMLPENIATIGSVEWGGGQPHHFRSASTPVSSRNYVFTPKTPVVQKPLPLTPFPVMAPP